MIPRGDENVARLDVAVDNASRVRASSASVIWMASASIVSLSRAPWQGAAAACRPPEIP